MGRELLGCSKRELGIRNIRDVSWLIVSCSCPFVCLNYWWSRENFTSIHLRKKNRNRILISIPDFRINLCILPCNGDGFDVIDALTGFF